MDTEVTKKLSTIIALKGASDEQIREAGEEFKENVFNNHQKIDVFQDLQSFLDIALENQDVYDKRKIEGIKRQMNTALDKAAQEMDLYIVNTPREKKMFRIAENIEIPDRKKNEFIAVLKKLGKRSKEKEDRATKVFNKWRLQRLAKKMMMTTRSSQNELKGEFFSTNTTVGAMGSVVLEDRMENWKNAYEEVKRELDESNLKLLGMSKLEEELVAIRKSIDKISTTLEIPLISNIEKESNQFYVKCLNMINFEIGYLKESAEEKNYQRALNEIEQLKADLQSANQIIEDLSEVNYQNERELQLSQRELFKHQNKLGTKIETTVLEMEKPQLINRIEELEEEHHHSAIETERQLDENKELQERIKKYENQLVYFKNNNEIQNKEIEHLKITKKLYENCLEEIDKYEREISNLRKEVMELNEVKRKFTKIERKLKRVKQTVEWDPSQNEDQGLMDALSELERARDHVSSLKFELEEERKKNKSARDEKELEILYENSQKEIETLNEELQNTWKKLNELDHTQLIEKLNKAEDVKIRLEGKIRNKDERISILEDKIKDLESENEKVTKLIKEPVFNSEDMLQIMNKIEETKTGQRLSHKSNQEVATSGEYLLEIKNLKSRLSKSELEKRNLNFDLKTQTFKENELNKYKEKLETLEKELEKTKKFRDGTIDIKKHESSIRKLENKNEKSQKKIKELESEIIKLRESEKDLSDELERVIKERELFIQAARTNRVNSAKGSSRGIEEAQNPSKKLIAIHSDKNEVDITAKPIGRIQLEELDLSLEQENQALRDELDFMTRLKDKFSKKLNEKRKEVIYVKEERDQAIKLKEELEDELDKVYGDVDRLEEEKIGLLKIIEELKSKSKSIKDYETEIGNLTIRIEIITNDNDELREKNEIYYNEIQTLKMKLEKFGEMNKRIVSENNEELDETIEELKEIRIKYSQIEVSLTEEIRLHKETSLELQHTVKRCEDLSDKLFHCMNEIEILKAQLKKTGTGMEDYEFKVASYNEIQNKLRRDLKEKIEEIMKRDELLIKRDEEIARHITKIEELEEETQNMRIQIELLEGKLKRLTEEKLRSSDQNNQRVIHNGSMSLNSSFNLETQTFERFKTYKILNHPVRRIVKESPSKIQSKVPRSCYKSIETKNNLQVASIPVYKFDLNTSQTQYQKYSSPVGRTVLTRLDLSNMKKSGSIRQAPTITIDGTKNSFSKQESPIRKVELSFHQEAVGSRNNSICSKSDIMKIRDLKNIPLGELEGKNKIKTTETNCTEMMRRSSSVPFNRLSTHASNTIDNQTNNILVSSNYSNTVKHVQYLHPQVFRNSNFAWVGGERREVVTHPEVLRNSSNSIQRNSFSRGIERRGTIQVITGYKNDVDVRGSYMSSQSQSVPRRSYSASKINFSNNGRVNQFETQDISHIKVRDNKERMTEIPPQIVQESSDKKTNHFRNNTFTSFFNIKTQNPSIIVKKNIILTSNKETNIDVENDSVKVIEDEEINTHQFDRARSTSINAQLSNKIQNIRTLKKKSSSPNAKKRKSKKGQLGERVMSTKILKKQVDEKYRKFKDSSKRKNRKESKEEDLNVLGKKLYNLNNKLKKVKNRENKRGITGKYTFSRDQGEREIDLNSAKKRVNMAKKISMLTGNGGPLRAALSGGKGKLKYFN